MRTGQRYKGKSAGGLEFYKLLCGDREFCAELGRAVLAAGRLEAELTIYLVSNSKQRGVKRATLGQLLDVIKKEGLLKKMQPVLELVKNQRNYLTHSIYALFAGMIEETLLERTGLLDSDVHTFMERAWQLAENLNDLAEIIAKRNAAAVGRPGVQ